MKNASGLFWEGHIQAGQLDQFWSREIVRIEHWIERVLEILEDFTEVWILKVR